MKRIAVTGASGMIGMSLIKLALDSDIAVTAIVRPGKTIDIDNKNLTTVGCDISCLDSCEINERCDAFFHLAWDKTSVSGRDDTETQLNNISYTLDASRLAKRIGCEVFVGAGSQAEFGNVGVPLNSGVPVNPKSGYGIAKYTAGKLSALLCAQLGLRHCWARILSVYGELDRDYSLISCCIDAMLEGNAPELTECTQIWDYIYCSDAANALLRIAMSGRNNAIYCIGSGSCAPLKDYVLKIRDIINPTIEPVFGAKPFYKNQATYLCADISELTRDTGFTPAVSFDEGIQRVIDYRKNKKSRL